MANLAYVPPGVIIEELSSPSVAPLLAIPGSICLVAMASGGITQTETVTLSTTATVANTATLTRVPTGSVMAANASTTVSGGSQSIPAPGGAGGTLTVGSTTNFSASGTIWVTGAVAPVTYTGKTSTTFTGCTAANGPYTPTNSGAVIAAPAIISVNDALNSANAPYGYSAATDWTFTAPSGNWNAPTIARQTSGSIADNTTVYVTYTYTPADYYFPIRLNSMADIQNRFGSAWNTSVTQINSPLAHAAQMVFENGASNVVLQPLWILSSGNRVQPASSDVAASATWQTVFNGLADLQDINILVPIVGQASDNVTDTNMAAIEAAAQDFCYTMFNGEGVYVNTVLAEDSSTSSTVAQDATIILHAAQLAQRHGGAMAEQTIMLNTSKFSRANATGSFAIGGQYVAAAVAGMLSSRPPQNTLTRQAVSGLLSVDDYRTAAAKLTDAQNGLLVVESRGNVVQIRHGITLDPTNVATREINVVRAKQYVIASINETLETQIIGQIIADDAAPTVLNNVVIATLEDLRGLGVLSNYDNVESRITSIDPTAMEVRFSYLPAYVVNYITVIFSLDLNANSITVSSTGAIG